MPGRLMRAAIGAVAVSLLSAHAAAASGSDVWTQWTATPQEAWIRSLEFTAAGTLVASSDGDGVFQSPASTGPWTQTNAGLDTPGDQSVFQVVASAGKLYAATASGLFTATQGPNPSWAQLGAGTGADKLNMGGIESVISTHRRRSLSRSQARPDRACTRAPTRAAHGTGRPACRPARTSSSSPRASARSSTPPVTAVSGPR